MNTNFKLRFNNDYFLELKDTETGKIKQQVMAKNVVLDKMWSNSCLIETSWNIPTVFLNGIKVGDGEGSPTSADTDLFHSTWSLDAIEHTAEYSGKDDSIIKTTLTAIFPANSSYVGDVSEVGLLADYGGLITHSLLKDAEGNPIVIHKTDLDELIVTVTMIFTMEGDGFQLLPLWASHLGGYFRPRNGATATLLCQTFSAMHRSKKGYSGTYAGDVQNSNLEEFNVHDFSMKPRPVYDLQTHIFNFNKSRIEADKGNNHYFNSFSLNNFGYWSLPNPNIFPYYDIENIEIGIGDDIKTTFKNPLNYFIKDSDKIYINDILLTRNVDYTIDYKNNIDMLVEISEGNFSYNYCKLDTYDLQFYPFFQACDTKDNQATDTGNKIGIQAPLYIDFKEEKEINTLRISGLKGDKKGAAKDSIFKLSYSENNKDYIDLLTTPSFDPYNGKVFHFDTIKKRYFKLEILEELNASQNTFYYMDTDKIRYPHCNECFIGYVGNPNIIFSTPPKKDAIIKMSVKMDRPFKNSNYVIDVTGEIGII